MNKKFRDLVLQGKFDEAYEISKNMRVKEICDKLIAISFDSKNMLAYGYVVHVLLRHESVEYHWIADGLLLNSYVDLDDAAELGLLHIKRAIEIDNSSFIALSALMAHASHPDSSATREDYEWAKKKIEELYPGDAILESSFGNELTPEQLKRSRLSKLI